MLSSSNYRPTQSYYAVNPNYESSNVTEDTFKSFRNYLPSIAEFRRIFKYFLLNFSLNGYCIYKERISKLDLVSNKYMNLNEENSNVFDQISSKNSNYGMCSMTIDLEHLNMTHWIPSPEDEKQLSNYDTPNILSNTYENEANKNLYELTESQPLSNSCMHWGELLVTSFRRNPLKYIGIAEECIREIHLDLLSASKQKEYMLAFKGIDNDNSQTNDQLSNYVQIENNSLTRNLDLFQLELISRQKTTLIRDISATSVESLVTVAGIVVQAYKPQHKAIRIKIQCKQCENQQWVFVPLWRQGIKLPRFCSVGSTGPVETRCPMDPYIILSDESDFCDVQTIKIQELPEQIPTGDMPRHLILNAPNSLCGRVIPGERILVIGVHSIHHKDESNASSFSTGAHSSYIHMLGLILMEKGKSRQGENWTFKEEEHFQMMARDPQIQNKIFKSIAPSLFGMEDIKKSIACLLFGGSRKYLPDGTRIRGDINILLLGDPSTAKSQFLKYVERVAPIAVYTSGKGSSAAGLTASVIRDHNGNFALEGGAMVLADGGVVCIDEFDKMRDDDRVAIHEAMEQQTISIAKAGITTVLTTRCSVLAAANPSFGSYDDTKETLDQHNFETTILSRFDLIWLMRDEKNIKKDETIAKHIIELHSGKVRTIQDDSPIPLDVLRDYINYCRKVCDPVLSEEASKKLENFYVDIREAMRQDVRKRHDQIPVAVRQLESLCRLAESLAKMTLSRFVTSEHIDEAIRLFRLSTVETAKGNKSKEFFNEAEKEKVRSAESFILEHLQLNNRVSKAVLIRDLKLRGIESNFSAKALSILIQQGKLQERSDASVKRIAL